ncbi:MAG: tRNA pseudouridine(38-40) synthase TruA [Elainellaceae cyanobacterium]
MNRDFADEPTQRVAIVIQYAGTHFKGWQRQTNGQTVQAAIEQAIESVLGHSVVIFGSGRTDSGVHAAAQVAHFDAPVRIPAHRWVSILNSRLPEGIVVRASDTVSSDWHACFSAVGRRYRYTIYNASKPNLFVAPYSWHYYRFVLDAEVMQSALESLVGYWDLSAFRRSGSTRPHSFLEVQEVQCTRSGNFLYIEIQASGFLYGMVRLLVGMLVEVGRGALSVETFIDIWMRRRRDCVKSAAPPQGLCLLRVLYPHFPISSEIWYDSQPLFILPSVL